MSFNKVILLGNLTRDPEQKELPSGMKVASFGLASLSEDCEEPFLVENSVPAGQVEVCIVSF